MTNKNRKYNILIVENKIKSETQNVEIYSKNNYSRIKIEDAKRVINSEEFDFIYFYEQEQKIMKRFKDYILLPKAFEKFTINNDTDSTYIHCSIILDIILDNIKIIEIEDRHKENIIESILEKILYSREENVDLEKIFIEVQQIFDKNNVKKEVEKIVYRNYAKSIEQIIKFHKNKEIIIKKFFNNLIHNIQNDIQEIKGVEGNIKVKKIQAY